MSERELGDLDLNFDLEDEVAEVPSVEVGADKNFGKKRRQIEERLERKRLRKELDDYAP